MGNNPNKTVLDFLKAYTNLNIKSVEDGSEEHIITIGGTLKEPKIKEPTTKELLKDILKRLDVIEKDVKAIKNCPTVKNELGGSGGN